MVVASIQESTSTGESSGMILFWDGIEATVPSEWSVVSKDICPMGQGWCNDFYNRTINISSAYGTEGGSDTYTGTVSHVISQPSVTRKIDPGTPNGFNVASATHTGTLTSEIPANTSIPPVRNLIIIRYDNGMPDMIPAGAIAFFNDTIPPENWTLYTEGDGYFLRGSDAPNTTLGSLTHTHINANFTLIGGGAAVGTSTGTTVPTPSHSHGTIGDQNLSEENHIPPYVDMPMIKATEDTPIPIGMIAVFNSTPPSYSWDNLSEDPNFNNHLIRINSSSFNTTGGSAYHQHEEINITFGQTSDTTSKKYTKLGGFHITVAGRTHGHTVNISVSSLNQPAYVTAILGIYTGIIIANESEGRDAIEEGINNTIPNSTRYEDQQIYIINETGDHSTGLFDIVTIEGNQTWAFNYVTGNESFTNVNPILTIVNIWESASLAYSQIVSQVEDLINETKE